MNIRKKISYAMASVLTGAPVVALAQGLQPVPNPGNTVGGNDLVGAIIGIINWLLILAALAAMIMLIYGGVQYIVSRGDEESASTAKNTILYAIIGLIVIGLAAVTVNFIVSVVANV